MEHCAFKLRYHHFNEKSILIAWPKEISKRVLEDINSFKAKIKSSPLNGQVLQTINAYQSLWVQFKDEIEDFNKAVLTLQNLYENTSLTTEHTTKNWKIPVCYDASFGLDLKTMCTELKVSEAELIKRHCRPLYTVYFIGFLPGFLYLGGLDKELRFPRKAIPRQKVAAGAVCIGDYQTGVYPNESPGGWNIIGNTPVKLFDPSKEKPCFAKAGDTLQFYPVDLKKHTEIKILVQNDVFINE